MYNLALLICLGAVEYTAATKHTSRLLRRDVLASRPLYSNTTRTPDEMRLDSAASCAHDILAWVTSSASWSYHHTSIITTAATSVQPIAGTALVVPSFDATSLTTLCDGHPRVVGFAQSTSTTTTIGGPLTYTTSIGHYPLGVYNVPPYSASVAPCSIAPTDCQSLYERNVSLVYGYNAAKICSFTTTSYQPANGQTCQGCVLRANNATLLYWPVRTVPGSANLCSGTPQTLGLTRTADSPNTFVTDGVTITSPSVGIALTNVSRQDGCYTTVASTIVVVHPAEVYSILSGRAWSQRMPFQFQDLNYKCQSQNGTEWIQDEPGDDCYQEVPADTYFKGESAFAWDEYYPTSVGPPMTIGPDYRPYILPPSTMTAWANSIFDETNCQIAINGVWDPPYALVQATAADAPHLAWQTASSTSSPSTLSVLPPSPYGLKPGSTADNPLPAWQTSAPQSSAEYDNEPATISTVEPSAPSVMSTPPPNLKNVLTVISQNQEAYTIIQNSKSILLVADGKTAQYPATATDGFAFGSVTLSASQVLQAMAASGQVDNTSTQKDPTTGDRSSSISVEASSGGTLSHPSRSGAQDTGSSSLPKSGSSSSTSRITASESPRLAIPLTFGLILSFLLSILYI